MTHNPAGHSPAPKSEAQLALEVAEAARRSLEAQQAASAVVDGLVERRVERRRSGAAADAAQRLWTGPERRRAPARRPAVLSWRFLMREADPEPVELTLGTYTLLWGLAAAPPGWSVFAAAPDLFAAMRGFAPEWAWGSAYVLVGASMLVGARWGFARVRRAAALVNAYIWAFAWASYAMADLPLPAVLTYAVPVLASAWVRWRVCAPARPARPSHGPGLGPGPSAEVAR